MTFNSDERFKEKAESLLGGLISLEQMEAPSEVREAAKQLAQMVSAYMSVGFSREESISIVFKILEMHRGEE